MLVFLLIFSQSVSVPTMTCEEAPHSMTDCVFWTVYKTCHASDHFRDYLMSATPRENCKNILMFSVKRQKSRSEFNETLVIHIHANVITVNE